MPFFAAQTLLTLHPRADLGLARAARLPILRRLIERAAALGAVPRRCRDLLPPVLTPGARP